MSDRVSKLELWGGVECTVNRVQDRFHDQLARNGHLERISDLDRFVELGMHTLRMPLLWELADDGAGQHRFERFDALFARARELGIRVIAGLVHHGSGPMRTNLLDPEFELGLERYAASVAERYPWIEDYTPINEPLTTARFSGLYGHWYPHARSAESFLRALVHETRATIRAMASIRARVPHARLIQTEDIGSVASTPLLAYQAEHENVRRWLSLDLLTGKVTPDHPLHRYVVDVGGITPDELAWIAEHACVPDIIGVNYYFTSDRYLDERLERHPAWSHGGNGRHAYADVHCSMLPERGLRGHRKVLGEVWQRYQLPMAITEVHAGATREDQLRWLSEAWEAAHGAREDGADVRALTVWSLLGSYDWNALVTQERGIYEPGVFDIRGGSPRPTAIASMVRGLATEGRYEHPVLAGNGWWRRGGATARPPSKDAPPILITGATGTLGQAFAAACRVRELSHHLLDRTQLDLTRPESIEAALGGLRPWAVINAAGYVRVDDAEHDRATCMRANAEGAAALALACARHGARYLTFSSDLVFDGAQSTPYRECDPTAPLSVYGESKVAAERQVLNALQDALVVRTSAFFGPVDAHNFVTHALRLLARGEHVRAAEDVTVSPTYLPHLVETCLDLLIDGASGLWHLANRGTVTWFALAQRAATATGQDVERVLPCRFHELGWVAKRPVYSALVSQHAPLMPSLDEAIEHYAAQVAAATR